MIIVINGREKFIKECVLFEETRIEEIQGLSLDSFEGENKGLEVHSWKYSSEMVSQHAMATTVRKVKQENRLRRQNQSQGTQRNGG